MTTIRSPRNKENPFVVLPTSIIRNSELSGTESRVLEILLSLPEGWSPVAKHLATLMRAGTYTISRAIQNLKTMGYLACRTLRDSLGRFLRTEWDVYEIPRQPQGENLDIHGNIIEFDRPTKSKNLRQAAKEKREKAKSETVTVSAFNPHLDYPNLDNCEGSNIDTSNIDQYLERDSAAQNALEKEILTAEECASESFVDRQVFVEDLGKERDPEADQCSATAESVVGELDNFKSQLEDLGKKLGRHSPLGWAFRIVENLRNGKSSTYWEEFKAGVPLGTSEQREWEIAPGVPCSIVKQCLEDHYLSKPGTTKQEAALQAGRSLDKPKQMQSLWQSIKERVLFLKHEADRLSEIGVQNSAIVDPWMKAKPEISIEDFSQAIATLQGSVTPQIEAAVEETTIIEGAIDTEALEESAESVEAVDPYAPTPESLAAREKARSLLKNKYGKLTKREEILAANIAEVEKMPVVESAKTVVVEYDDEPILW